MSRRYFLEASIVDSKTHLAGDEAKHLAKVLRARPGEQVTLFAGDGLEHLAQILSVGKSQIELGILSSEEVSRESPRFLRLAVALPKGDRQRFLIEKCVELGVSQIVPLVAARSVAQPSGKALQRCRRYVIESAKQCGRNQLLRIDEACTAEQFWNQETTGRRLVAHPYGEGLTKFNALSGEDEVTIAVGPEGGFTDDEIAGAQSAGWTLLHLGPRILRVETAAFCVAARLLD
ncbi:MAG TPA: 16S rRNA (uracil(1498)-N(3))-methyltransferase [Planctomycetes bacterium]|nr:16S rRNA (uracil(1498)-N(3))-methyltransferase [Planctomycetaceae bacterium]HIM29720.1 16S rRNA (uracil(1498)-N(3))-methyltransferase [Planctomycetota bacterium]